MEPPTTFPEHIYHTESQFSLPPYEVQLFLKFLLGLIRFFKEFIKESIFIGLIRFFKEFFKESIFIRVNNPTLNRNISKFNLPHICDRLLLNTPGLALKRHVEAVGHANSNTPI